MTRSGIGKFRERSLAVKKKKGEDMETLKAEVELISEKPRSARKRSSGKRGRKKFPVSSRKITNSGRSRKFVGKKPRRRQCRLQIEMMELANQLAKMNEEIRDWRESPLAVNAVMQAEAKRELLIQKRDLLRDKLSEMNAIEDFLKPFLGFP